MKCPCHGELSLMGPEPQDHLELTPISDTVDSSRSFYIVFGVHCARTLSGYLGEDVRFSTCATLSCLRL